MLRLGKKLADGKGLSGKGRLTLAHIDAIQNFYGRAIRDNTNDAETMAKSTWAILDHYSSTPENPRHDKCPLGETSWCSYQRDLTTGQTTHVPVKWPFSDAIVDTMKPLFTRLTDPALLENCKDARTQNPNESFNHVIWNLAPKEQLVSPLETSLAINIAVSLFNSGLEATMQGRIQRRATRANALTQILEANKNWLILYNICPLHCY